MATMNFSVPDDVKSAFNETFEGENKSAVAAEWLMRAVEDRRRQLDDADFIERIRRRRAAGRTYTTEEIRKAREDGRP